MYVDTVLQRQYHLFAKNFHSSQESVKERYRQLDDSISTHVVQKISDRLFSLQE